MLQLFYGILPQTCASTQSYHIALRSIPSTSWLRFCSDIHLLYRQVCAFPNHVQSIEFTTGGLQLSCRHISRMINGNRMHLSSILSLIENGLNSYVNKVFLFLFLIHLQNFYKPVFYLSLWGIACRLMIFYIESIFE